MISFAGLVAKSPSPLRQEAFILLTDNTKMSISRTWGIRGQDALVRPGVLIPHSCDDQPPSLSKEDNSVRIPNKEKCLSTMVALHITHCPYVCICDLAQDNVIN
jgi:hypothetical protein